MAVTCLGKDSSRHAEERTAVNRRENRMNNDHSKVLALILKSEGGLNEDEPTHVGGVSYAGITQKSYTEWRSKSGMKDSPKSVRDLKDHHKVVNAFYDDYFEKYHTWELPEFLQYIYADFVVNAGSAAVKIIQRMVEVDDDGMWGSGTSKAAEEWKLLIEVELEDDPNVDNNLITEFHEQKLAHYNNLSEANPDKYGRYLAGWKRRCNSVLAELSNYFEDDVPTPKAVDENEPEQEKQQALNTDRRFTNDPIDINKVPTIQLLEEIARRIGDKEIA